MVADHSKAGDALKAVAAAKGLGVPTAPAATHRRLIDRLGKRTGPVFDREYMKLMVSEHKRAVGLFARQAQAGKDADFKAFAADTLPTLTSRYCRRMTRRSQHCQSPSSAVAPTLRKLPSCARSWSRCVTGVT